jgi:hypothetical protein
MIARIESLLRAKTPKAKDKPEEKPAEDGEAKEKE